MEKKLQELIKMSNIRTDFAGSKSMNTKHRLTDEVERVVEAHIASDLESAKEAWQLVASDDTNNMKVYRREVLENGVVHDPLKAVCTVKVRKKLYRSILKPS